MNLTLSLLLSTLLTAPTLSAPPMAKLSGGELKGRVLDEKGKPISGALVGLSSARPRVGIPTTCPSCYRDCAKTTKTDGDGQFALRDLDPELLFRVLVLAPGKRGKVTELVDPAKQPLEVQLESLPMGLSKDRMIQGRVVGPDGAPVVGAIVNPTGAKTQEKRWWGQLPGVDRAAVTDVEGNFVITSQDPKLGLDLTVGARGFATFPGTLFELTGAPVEIRLVAGASISGRLLHDGKPVKNRAIGIVQEDRGAGRFVGETTLATDENGGFLFANLQANENYVLYSLCQAKQDLPVFKTLRVRTGKDGEMKELGVMTSLTGITLKGQVKLPEGTKFPSGAKISLSRDPAWDWSEAILSEKGDFTLPGLPPEVYTVTVHAPGFAIDGTQPNFQMTGESSFGIRLKPEKDPVKIIQVMMKPKGGD